MTNEPDPLETERALAEAVLSKDRAAAARVLADDFVGIGHLGNVVDKATYLDIHFSDERDFTRFEVADRDIRRAGSAFLVFGTAEIVNARAGEAVDRHRMSAVYAPGPDGDLKLQSWHETIIVKDKI